MTIMFVLCIIAKGSPFMFQYVLFAKVFLIDGNVMNRRFNPFINILKTNLYTTAIFLRLILYPEQQTPDPVPARELHR